MTLCGKPAPKLTWTIDGQTINGTVDSSKADEHQYTYSFATKVSSEMCGKVIKYEAIGLNDVKVTRNSTILMSNCKLIFYTDYLIKVYRMCSCL